MPRNAWKNLPRLYNEQQLEVDALIVGDSDMQHYLLHVLRKGTGDDVLLFNALHGEWRARITLATKKQLALTCLEQTQVARTEPSLGLAFAPIKRDHQDYMIQKACELGVTAFHPLQTQHGVVTQVNLGRWRAIAREAAEQSERLGLPGFSSPSPLFEAVTSLGQQHMIYACLENGEAQPIANAIRQNSTDRPPLFLTGPEGGFSAEEMTKLSNCANVIPISLGPRILRADTAAIAALSCWQALRGDWQI